MHIHMCIANGGVVDAAVRLEMIVCVCSILDGLQIVLSEGHDERQRRKKGRDVVFDLKTTRHMRRIFGRFCVGIIRGGRVGRRG